MLRILDVQSIASTGYVQKTGIKLNQRTVVSIQSKNHLVAGAWYDMSEKMHQDFAVNIEEHDMFFLAMPDEPPVQVYSSSIEVAAVRSQQSLLKTTVGVCELTTKNGQGLSPDSYIYNHVLSARMLRAMDDKFIGYPDESLWMGKWDNSLKISVITPPKKGVIEGGAGYQPNNGFYGKDRVDFLVEGKTEWGQPFSITVRYYIHVLNDSDMDMALKGNEAYSKAVKQLCGTNTHYWRISGEDAQTEFAIASDFLATWQTQSQLSALLASASSVQPVFSDLPGASLGLSEGTGWNASITLDTNAAGHGWYVDATPWSVSDDYLPTSDPNLWLAKPGSGAEGKMDTLSVWLHELGHAAGMEHTESGTGLMGTILLPAQRRIPCTAELQQMFSYLQANGALQGRRQLARRGQLHLPPERQLAGESINSSSSA